MTELEIKTDEFDRIILQSIKPQYAKKIYSGEKTIELRKSVWSKKSKVIYIYETSPVQKITGYYHVKRIFTAHPDAIYNIFKNRIGISKKKFKEYFKDKEIGYAIEIKDVKELADPVDPYEIFRDFHAPQNFYYLDLKKLKLRGK